MNLEPCSWNVADFVEIAVRNTRTQLCAAFSLLQTWEREHTKTLMARFVAAAASAYSMQFPSETQPEGQMNDQADRIVLLANAERLEDRGRARRDGPPL